MEFTGGKKHFPQDHGAKSRDQEIADRGFQREEGGAFVVEPKEELKGAGTHMDKPLVTDISDPHRDEPLQSGGQFVGGPDAEIAHRGFDRKAGGAFQDEPKGDLHGKGTHMDKPLVTGISDSKRDEPLQDETFAKDRDTAIADRGFDRKAGGAFKEEPRGDLQGKGTHLDKPLVNDPKTAFEEPIQTGEGLIGDRDNEIAHRGFDRKAGGAFKEEPKDDLHGKGTHMDKPLVTGGEERKEGVAPPKELLTKASKHVEGESNPGEKIRERFDRTANKAVDAELGFDKPLVSGYGNFEEPLHKEDLTKVSHDIKEETNPGGKIRERFERTLDKVDEAKRSELAEKFLIEKQNMDAGLKEEEVQHYLDKKEQRI